MQFKSGMIMKVSSEFVPDFWTNVFVILVNQEGILISRPEVQEISVPIKKETILDCKVLTPSAVLRFESSVIEIYNEGYVGEDIAVNKELLDWVKNPCIMISYPSNIDSSDRRKSKRVYADYKALINKVSTETLIDNFKLFENIKNSNFNATVKNISSNGFFIETDLKLSEDESVIIGIQLKDKKILGPAYARVVRCEEKGYGLNITGAFENDIETLYKLISKYT